MLVNAKPRKIHINKSSDGTQESQTITAEGEIFSWRGFRHVTVEGRTPSDNDYFDGYVYESPSSKRIIFTKDGVLFDEPTVN